MPVLLQVANNCSNSLFFSGSQFHLEIQLLTLARINRWMLDLDDLFAEYFAGCFILRLTERVARAVF